ncbi:MAG: (Fe-S)-binding protein [Cyclobacteriaceae bacterium]|nr:(Fe-S)-binding protein [Cyclobacteriaceae bacterium]
MILLHQIGFVLVSLIAAYFFLSRLYRIRENILMGREIDRTDQPKERWKRVFLIAFGQKKMFKKPIPALLHLLVYLGFLIINIEGIEFFLDGITGRHRTIARLLEKWDLSIFYTITLNLFELLAVGVIVACVVFLIRRNILGVKRFQGIEMTRWPKLDANLILVFEILLMFAIMSMNAADQILQERNVSGFPNTGLMVFSDIFASPFYQHLSTPTLIIVERVAWWMHIIGIFGFAVYVTYSKHLHTFMAFPNVYYSNLEPAGKITNMPEVTREVRSMLGMPQEVDELPGNHVARFGAKDITDLSWKNLMDAYTCTECGRCTDQCPANQTGKKLSPRKIMMDTRDRAEMLGALKAKHGKEHDDGKSLLDDFIIREELFACTSCNACVEACPVMIDPLSIILQLRRYLAMEESGTPQEWNAMFSNIENNFSPWKFAASDRFNWANDLTEKR